MSLISSVDVDRACSRPAIDRQHLEDGARLVDVADDRVDEAARVARGDRAVVVGVVGRVRRVGVDLAGVRVHDDRGDAAPRGPRPRPRAAPARRQLQAGVDRQPDVRPRTPGVGDERRLRDRPDVRRRAAHQDARRAGQQVLVALLHAVLALALAVDEAEQVRRERESGPPPRCGYDADRLRLERDARRPICRPDLRPDPVGQVGSIVARQDRCRRVRSSFAPGGEPAGVIEPQDRGRATRRRGGLGASTGSAPRPAAPLDGRGQHDDAAPVVDRTAMARLGGPSPTSAPGPRPAGEVPVDDLPPAESTHDRRPPRRRRRRGGRGAAPGIGPAQHRSIDRLACGNDERARQAGQTRSIACLRTAGSRPRRLRSDWTSRPAT